METKKLEQSSGLQKEFTFLPTKQSIRVELINEQPWFVAKDVCDILGISRTNDALKRLDDDEKLMRIIYASGQRRSMRVVNESGLYALILRSSKPEAKNFRKWVTSEVLPSLRQKGYYGISDEVNLMMSNLASGLSVLIREVGNLIDVLTVSYDKNPKLHEGVKNVDSTVIDARHKTFDFVSVLGDNVRHIIINDKDWYSMNDILTNLKVRTSSGQIARKLGSKMCCKIRIYGNTHPAWFCSKEGMKIILAGSRKYRSTKKEGGVL